MKKRTLVAIVSLLSMPMVSMDVAHAQQSDAAATVTRDFGCYGFVPTADGGFGDLIYTGERTHAVANSGGTTSLICHFVIPDGEQPATATESDGFLCYAFTGYTNDTKMVATPGGQATLTCKIQTN